MSPTTRGILAMIAANACFIANDALMKLVMERLPLGQSIFFRGVVTGAIFLAIFRFTSAVFDPAILKDRRVIYRVLAEIVASAGYLFALIGMPIADLAGVLQLVPLAIMAGAAVFLGETIGWRRWTAAVVGLVGALMIVRPGLDLSVYQVMAIICIIGIVVRDLITRRLPSSLSSIAISATSAAGLAAFGLALGITETWAWPDRTTTAYLVVAAIFLVGANTWLVTAMRNGEIGVVGPFRYTSLIWAILAGFAIWGEIPTFWSWIGMVILVGAGIYSLRRQQLRKSSPLNEPASTAAHADTTERNS